MKKIISILLAIAIIASGAVFAEDYSDKATILSALNAVSDSNDVNAYVTRQEFAQAAAVINGAEALVPVDTAFDDVKAANPYSGYVNYLAQIGYIDQTATFNPEDYCTREFVLTLALKVAGYGEYIDMMGGFEIASSKLKLSQAAIFENGYLTFEGLTELMYQVLYVPLPNISYTTVGGSYMETVKTYSSKLQLGEMLGLSIFNGTLTDMDYNNYRVIMTVDEVVYAGNTSNFGVGKEHGFDADLSVDINKYEMVPVTFWVDKNDKIIAMYPQEDYEVLYAPIYSVNDDDDTTSSYSISNIDTLMLLDDEKEYDVDPNAIARHNFQKTTKAQRYAGSYAKIVMYNKDVVYIETWDLAEGGILTDIDDTFLTYKKGNGSYKINPITQFERKYIIINDESRDYGDLKTDTYFDIYKVNNDTLVMVATEKIITSTFYGIGDESITIGNVSYIIADKLYFSADGIKYNADRDALLEAAGMEVDVYFNSVREACYIKLSDGQTIASNNFIGLVTGYKEKTFSENAQFGVINLEGDDFTRQVYNVSNKYNEGTEDDDVLTLNEVAAEAGNIDGSGIFLFTINANNEIKKISKPVGIRGFTDSQGYTGRPNANVNGETEIKYDVPGGTNVSCLINGKRYYYDINTDLRVISVDEDGKTFVTKIRPKQTTGNSIVGINGSSQAALRLFGYEDSMDLRLGVLLNVKTLYKWDDVYGFAKKGGIVLGEDEEIFREIIITNSEGAKTYKLSQELADQIPTLSYVRFYLDSKVSQDEIFFRSTGVIADLSGDFNTWADTNKSTLRTGVVEEMYSNGFIITDGTPDNHVGYSFIASDVQVMRVGERGKDGAYKLEKMELDNIGVGDSITFMIATEPQAGIVKAIFVR